MKKIRIRDIDIPLRLEIIAKVVTTRNYDLLLNMRDWRWFQYQCKRSEREGRREVYHEIFYMIEHRPEKYTAEHVKQHCQLMMRGMEDTEHMTKKIYLDNQGSSGWRDWEE